MIRYLLLLTVCLPLPVAADTPEAVASESAGQAVKLSSSGTCYTEENVYYDKILKYKTYSSIEACVQVGGHLPSQQQDAGWGVPDCNSPDLEALGLKYMCTDRKK